MFRQKTGRYQLNLTPHMIQSIKSDNKKKKMQIERTVKPFSKILNESKQHQTAT